MLRTSLRRNRREICPIPAIFTRFPFRNSGTNSPVTRLLEFATLPPAIFSDPSRVDSLDLSITVDNCCGMKASPYSRVAEPVVITGISVITSVGEDKESTWRAVRDGKSGVTAISGLPAIPDNLLLGAPRPRCRRVSQAIKGHRAEQAGCSASPGRCPAEHG